MNEIELSNNGERLITSVVNENSIYHLHRYALTFDIIRGKKVLDIASGEGYGSNLMSDYAEKVVGVDISLEAIEHSINKYGSKHNLSFICNSALKLPFKNAEFDCIVSFETLEHIKDQDILLQEFKRVLKPEGILIISTPDKYNYSDKRDYCNPYHVKELYLGEFKELLSKYFLYYNIYLQKVTYGSLILAYENSAPLELFTGDFDGIRSINDHLSPKFSVACCSNVEVVKKFDSFFEAEKILQINYLNYEKQLVNIKKSLSYKIGNTILSPFRFIKHLF